MSSDVMQHELVERARESGTLTKADITKAWFIYWLARKFPAPMSVCKAYFLRSMNADHQKNSTRKKEEQVEALKRH